MNEGNALTLANVLPLIDENFINNTINWAQLMVLLIKFSSIRGSTFAKVSALPSFITQKMFGSRPMCVKQNYDT